MIGSLFVPYLFTQKCVLGVWLTMTMARKVFCSIISFTPNSWKRSLNWLWSGFWLADPLASLQKVSCDITSSLGEYVFECFPPAYLNIFPVHIWIFSTCIFGGLSKSGNTGAENPASWAFIQVQTLTIKLQLLWWILSACVCAPTSGAALKRKFLLGLNFDPRLMSPFSLVVRLGPCHQMSGPMTIDHASSGVLNSWIYEYWFVRLMSPFILSIWSCKICSVHLLSILHIATLCMIFLCLRLK